MHRIFVHIFVIGSLLLLACNKKEFNSYTGTYNCIKSVHTWEEGEPHEYENTVDHTVNVVKQKKKRIQVFDLLVHIDSIAPNQLYKKGTADKYQSVIFSENEIRYLEHTKVGNGGYEISYIGNKIEEE